MTKERIKIISLVGLLVFGLLLSGRLLYNEKWVDANLIRQSQQIPGVVSVGVVNSSGQQEFDVTTKNVSDLSQTSAMLSKLAGKLPIRYLDNRTPAQEALYNQMQFALQEGIVRGDFVRMAQEVAALGKDAGMQVNLTMDSNEIYLTLTQGTHQLVAVLDRHGEGKFLPSEARAVSKGGST
ncbi:Hypothetical protein DEACI_3173 [Acididesulfobacillus acetoxydans]|uniref:Uncharacterized protein n=1 Tax=Acididesulfobacillus acetoxydans TaxID=1561005 RepID=A0A8S0W4K9_9FIRM|nr:hypothetical protein [Acididesulfobacillus acetoxydans]CAA7602498.1 Hypothetical protein DEACI_3173 [Acididesulfobacillus acetoxydans]CEJ05953.1 Hypothetical protein DEACI_0373 [Acididesulfobacillus acetoxydans]